MPGGSDDQLSAPTVAVAVGTDPLSEAESHVKEMEDMEDYYFGADKQKKLVEVAAAINACVERAQASPESMRAHDLKARSLFLRGRSASFIAGQERRAEELLSKAIKLDPLFLNAWNALGEVYWNLHDVAQAKQCFEQAVELCGPNPISLRNLSMALRALNSGERAERRAENYALALAKAKEAVALGPGDPLNWETLGNAYVGDFFVNAKRPDEVNRALIAYEKAETAYEKLGKRNPTLHFNRGMAAKYLQDYQLSLRSFESAHNLGSASAAEEARKVLELVQRLAASVERKHDLKGKHLKELSAELPRPGSDCRALRHLQAGESPEAPVVARVVFVVDRKSEVPVISVCCDALGDFFALAVYNADMQKFAEAVMPLKTVVSLSRAKFLQVSVSSPSGKTWSYSCATVEHPADVLLDTGGTLAGTAVQSVVFSTSADWAATEKTRTEKVASAVRSAASTVRRPVTMVDCQRKLQQTAREASVAGKGRAAVIEALIPAVRSLVESELGCDSVSRLRRIEAMFTRMGRNEVHTEESEQHGKRYAPGFVEGLVPNLPFHDEQAMPWCNELKKHWRDIRDELRSHLDDSGVWVRGAYADSNKAYAPDWKIACVLTADKWQAPRRWRRTQAILKTISDVIPFEVFFARMPPHTTIAAHSDNLNYILTSHLALELEKGMCSIRVGSQEREWEEGEMLVFDTTYIHSAWNDSDRDRYVLVFRFWHPALTLEERRAIHISHALLAGTPDPEKLRQGATTHATMSLDA